MKPRRCDSRSDRDGKERAGAGDRASATTARSSIATRRPCIAASTSAPTSCRASERQGIPHHLIDIVDPTEEYTAAQFARDASQTIREIHARGRLPLVVGGTGFYYRALTRGLFPGPGRDADVARAARVDRGAARRDVSASHASAGSIRESAVRIQPRDLKRIVRALEVFFLTGRPLTAHFAETVSPIPDVDMIPIALRLPAAGICGTRDAPRRSAVRARADGRDSRAAGARRAGDARVRSAASSIDRRSSTCTAFATKRQPARSSRRRIGAMRGVS